MDIRETQPGSAPPLEAARRAPSAPPAAGTHTDGVGLSEASDRQGRRRVVLLDDNPFVRETYRALLGESGWDVRCAANAEEAIAIVGLDGVDALLVDVQMAGRDGLAVLEALARWHPHLLRRVALHTGYADEERVRSTAGRYGVVLLEKPCRAETLLATLDALASS